MGEAVNQNIAYVTISLLCVMGWLSWMSYYQIPYGSPVFWVSLTMEFIVCITVMTVYDQREQHDTVG